jgi:hypothetical protein
MEATNIVWYPITAYFMRRGATAYVVNPRMANDLARFYKRYAKSDRLAAKVLARLPIVSPDTLSLIRQGVLFILAQSAADRQHNALLLYRPETYPSETLVARHLGTEEIVSETGWTEALLVHTTTVPTGKSPRTYVCTREKDVLY